MKNKFKFLIASVSIAMLFLSSCEKDLYEDAIQQSQDKQINIKQISLEQFNSKLVQMKDKPGIEGFMVSPNSNSFQNRASSGSDFEIITDDIKEITQGDYTSYTMYVKTPDTTNSIYNITIEEINDNTSLFLTKYEPSNNWTITSNRNFEGNVITYRISGTTDDPVVLASLFTEAFEGLQEGGYNGIGAGSGGSSSSNSYPYDCNGYVYSTTIITETKCGCGHDWQDLLTNVCTGCDGALPAFPSLSTSTVYECIPVDNGSQDNPGDTAGGGGNTGNSNAGGNTSLTTIVDPTEECNAPRGDLNNDCILDENEANFITFLDSLTTQERQLIIGNNTTKMTVFNYLVSQNWSNESQAFAQEFLENCVNSGLNLNFKKSLKSPANVDVTLIDTTTIVGKKFNCIYKKLMQSTSFKNLFDNTFGGSQTKLNVKFEIVESFPNPNTLGNCQLTTISDNGVPQQYNNLIKIKREILDETNGSGNASNIKIAKVIIHELMHAYLNIKYKNCNQGASLPYINNLEIGELIQLFYENFNCHIDVNGSPQSQHDFMYNFLIPSFQSILSECRDLLISQSHINYANGINFEDTSLNINENWNWDKFFKYITLNGVHNCDSFTETTTNNPIENYFYQSYTQYENQVTKNCL